MSYVVAPSSTNKPIVRSWDDMTRHIAYGEIPEYARGRDNDAVSRAWNTYTGGASGGYFLDYELSRGVWDKARSIDGPLARCLLYETSKIEFDFPSFDETSRVAGSRWGGIRARWKGQKDDFALGTYASQPKLNSITFVMQACVVYSNPFSRDLLSDAPLAKAMLDYAAHQEIKYAIEDSMFNGIGDGEPYGILQSPASLSVTRNSGGTIKYQDIDTMWAQMWPFCRRNAVWHCSDDTLGVIDSVATAANWPETVYWPIGYQGNPWPYLKGRPLIVVEQLPALGYAGDLVLVDWTQYAIVIHKSPDNQQLIDIAYGRPEIGIEGTMSDHKLFDTEECVFKYKFLADGKLMWRSSVTVADASQSNSCAIYLK
jgi:HK97 family phage major capsid protein